MKIIAAVPEKKIRQLHFRKLSNDEVVGSVDVSDGVSFYRRIKRGMEINMREDLYVDDSEFADVKDPRPLLSEIFNNE